MKTIRAGEVEVKGKPHLYRIDVGRSNDWLVGLRIFRSGMATKALHIGLGLRRFQFVYWEKPPKHLVEELRNLLKGMDIRVSDAARFGSLSEMDREIRVGRIEMGSGWAQRVPHHDPQCTLARPHDGPCPRD